MTPITTSPPNQDQHSAVNCKVHQRNQNAPGCNKQIGHLFLLNVLGSLCCMIYHDTTPCRECLAIQIISHHLILVEILKRILVHEIWSLSANVILEGCLRAQYFEKDSYLLTPITINQPNQDQCSTVNCRVPQHT